MITTDYLSAVRAQLDGVTRVDRRRVLDALSAQLDELSEAGVDPETALGDPESYARDLTDAVADGSATAAARWRLFGLPVELRGPVSPEVRSRTWDPANPRLFVPRQLGIGWTLNLGAIAVGLRLIRPDDAGDDVLAGIPPRQLRRADAVPMAIAAATAAALAAAWRTLPPTVAGGFGIGGRAQRRAPRWTLIAVAALGAVPALWAQRRDVATEDRLVRSATATSLAVVSAGVVAATLADARAPRGRWGLLTIAALPAAIAAALAVVVVPLRAGLRRAWQSASPSMPVEPVAAPHAS